MNSRPSITKRMSGCSTKTLKVLEGLRTSISSENALTWCVVVSMFHEIISLSYQVLTNRNHKCVRGLERHFANSTCFFIRGTLRIQMHSKKLSKRCVKQKGTGVIIGGTLWNKAEDRPHGTSPLSYVGQNAIALDAYRHAGKQAANSVTIRSRQDWKPNQLLIERQGQRRRRMDY